MFFLKKLNNLKKNGLNKLSLNFGPQHPAAHGVLRLLLNLKNEIINMCDPHIGLLHRGTEKLIENKIYIHALPYFDRLDYVSTITQENLYCIAVDKIFDFNQKPISSVNRTIFDEITRIFNHFLAISCHALDVGSMSTIFWSFEEREKIMEIYESITGARMHAILYKPISNLVINNALIYEKIIFFCKNSYITINEMHNVLTNNKIWKKRLIGVGIINYNYALSNGLTGVLSRSSGLLLDFRLNKYTTYNNYKHIRFNSYVSNNGDSYDRYILRIYEMIESLEIINKSIINYGDSIYKNINCLFYDNMESTILHFKKWSSGLKSSKNIINSIIEAPKGEFSLSLFSDNSEKPYRCKIKSPSLNHLFVLKKISKNLFLSDLVTLIGTIDIVFGEIDR